ncbi:hypothetical protein [Shewanella woodyi]|uniref:hypothetical protein n=1 Tax=Shewanella woodyi TaxID=60961 RepID=UPI003748D384
MRELAWKAAVLLLSVDRAKRSRILNKMDSARVNEVKLALQTAEELELTFDDFAKLKLPIQAFECDSIDEVNWLRSHALDRENLKIKEKAKKAFLCLLTEGRGSV